MSGKQIDITEQTVEKLDIEMDIAALIKKELKKVQFYPQVPYSFS